MIIVTSTDVHFILKLPFTLKYSLFFCIYGVPLARYTVNTSMKSITIFNGATLLKDPLTSEIAYHATNSSKKQAGE